MAVGFAARRQYSAMALLLPAVQAVRERAGRTDTTRGVSTAYDFGTCTAETLVGRITNFGVPGANRTELVVSAADRSDGAGPAPFIPDIGDEVLVAFTSGSAALSRVLGSGPTISFIGCGLTPSRVGSSPVSGLARRLGAVINCAEPRIGSGYQYDSAGSGRQLLGHELTHIVQQRGGGEPTAAGVQVRGWNAADKVTYIGPGGSG